MKRTILALLAALALAGCSGTPTATATLPVQSSSAEASTAPSGGTFSEAEFAKMVRDGAGYFEPSSDDLINKSARDLCAIFTPSKGGNATALWRSLIDSMVSNGVPAKDAGSFVVFAVAQYCPAEYMYLPKP